MNIEKIYKTILDCAFNVHKALGPGLLENTYKQCLAQELRILGFKVEVEKELPLVYKGIELECAYRVDILVEDQIIIELKNVKELNNLHLSQILSYMKLSNTQLGLLINFNKTYLKHGIKRVVLQENNK